MPLVSKTFSQIITFTRASSATYFDAAGVLQTATTDVPRFDYNPSTLAALGVLIEESRTNSIRNNTMQGAVAGTPGTNPTNWTINNVFNGLTKEIVGTGTTNGITWIDVRWSGTTTAAGSTVVQPESIIAVTAATGQSWSASAWWAIVGGSTANITAVSQRVSGRSAAGSLLEQTDYAITLTATLTRYEVSRTMTNASTERVTNDISFSYNSGNAIDITLRIGLPQLEQGAFATSVIPTTTTAVTRAADVASVNTLSPWFNAAEGTIYAEAVGVNNVSGSTRRFVEISDGTLNNRYVPGYSLTTNTRFLVSTGGSVQADIVVNGVSAGSLVKIAGAYAVNDFQQASNGTLGANDTSGALPAVTTMHLGSDYSYGANTTLNGYLRRITYYPRRLSNAELQTLTT